MKGFYYVLQSEAGLRQDHNEEMLHTWAQGTKVRAQHQTGYIWIKCAFQT